MHSYKQKQSALEIARLTAYAYINLAYGLCLTNLMA